MTTKDLNSRRNFLKLAGVAGTALAGGMVAACSGKPTSEEGMPEAQAVAGDVLAKILQEKKMTAAVVIYPPDTFQEGDELKGTFIEAAEWLAQQLEFELNYEIAAFGTFIAAIQSGRTDIAVAPVFATTTRAIAVDFTKPMYYLGYSALVRKEDVNKWKSIEDADQPGVRFVEREGTPCHKWLEQNLEYAALISMAPETDPAQEVLEVITERADMYIQDDWLIKNLVAEHSTELAELPAYTDTPWHLNRVTWAVAKGQTSLVNVLNVAIDELLGSGLLQKWQAQFGGHGLYVKESFYTPSA